VTPFNVSGVPVTTPAASTISTPSITPSVDGCKVVAIYGVDTSTSPYPATPDSSPAATERIEAFFSTPNQSIYVQDYDQTTAAALALDATFTAGPSQIAYALAIAPSTAPAVFSVLATGDDGYVDAEGSTGTTWPPDGAVTANTSGTTFLVRKLKASAFTDLIMGLLRFDTSLLPDAATITAATLRLQITAVGNVTNRNIVAGYYDSSNWPISSGDWSGSDNPGSDAGTFALTGFSASTTKDLALSSPSSISKTGYTGFRLGVDGGIPSVNNDDYRVEMAAVDHASLTEPLLLVTYTTGLTPPYVSVSIA
jgi:hypothetical protein